MKEPLRHGWTTLGLLGALLLAAAALRIYRLGEYSLWLDEAHTWLFTRADWGNFLTPLRLIGVHPPLYFFLDKLVASLVGDGEVGLRLLSVCADLASICLAACLGWKSGGRAGMFTAAWFWAFNPLTLWYAQDARPYALASLLSMTALLLFLAARGQLTPGRYIFAGAVLALGMVTHFFFFLVTGALVLLSLLQIRQSPRLFRRWTALSLAAMLPLAAWLGWFFLLPSPVISIGWIQFPQLADLPLTMWNLVSGYGGEFSLPTILFGMLSTGLILFGLSVGTNAPLNRQLILIGVILPLCLTWLISFRRPVYVDRYFIVLLPFLIPALGGGSDQAMRRLQQILPARMAGTLAIVILGSVGLFNAWQVHRAPQYFREDWKNLAGHLYQQLPEEIPFWFHHAEMIAPLEYYYRENFTVLESGEPPVCNIPCWWVLRQPYTATHAFTQSVTDPKRPWVPQLPPDCQLLNHWGSPTGIALWKIDCP